MSPDPSTYVPNIMGGQGMDMGNTFNNQMRLENNTREANNSWFPQQPVDPHHYGHMTPAVHNQAPTIQPAANNPAANQHERFWQYDCKRCGWLTNGTYDGHAVAGLMAELKFHTKEVHGNEWNSGKSSSGLTEREEYRLATELRDIPAGQDDRNYTLHPARFFPGSVNWKNAVKNSPIIQNPRLSRIDLSHVGLHALNRKVIYT